jgi:hypothetical protein
LETGEIRGLRGRLRAVDRVAERRVPAAEGVGEGLVLNVVSWDDPDDRRHER